VHHVGHLPRINYMMHGQENVKNVVAWFSTGSLHRIPQKNSLVVVRSIACGLNKSGFLLQ
jgi:hypothetical protein